ncbi:MAG: MATE family efflux transporter [Nodosilinea sp. LVE1205-7]
MVYWGFGFLRMGTTGLTAQAMGQEQPDETLLILLRHGVIALGLGVAILVLQVPIRHWGFALMGAEADLKLAGYAFYQTRIWDAPAVLLNLVVMGWCLGREQGRGVMLLSLVGNGSNVALNYLFIRQWGWASAGAGLATALSQYLMLAVGLGIVRTALDRETLARLLPQLWQGEKLRQILSLNRDILIRTSVLILSFALFARVSATLGSLMLAANTLLLQVVTLSAYFIDGIAFATESFAGRCYGTGDRQGLGSLLRLGSLLSLLLGLGFAAIFISFPQALFGLLTSHAEVITQVRSLRGWLGPVLAFGAIAYLLDGFFLGLTARTILRNGTLLAGILGFLPLALIAQEIASPHLLWLALTALMAGRALTLAGAVPRWLSSKP